MLDITRYHLVKLIGLINRVERINTNILAGIVGYSRHFYQKKPFPYKLFTKMHGLDQAFF